MPHVGWYPRRRGILEHLEKGTISLIDNTVHDVLSLWADHKSGVCFGSAEKILALYPTGVNYKVIQRSLAKLDRIGWIKRWIVKGRRGNYPILICRYFVRDASMTWWSTNGDRTSDWMDVQFDLVRDPSFNRPSEVREVGGEQGGEVSGGQEVEVRIENQEGRLSRKSTTTADFDSSRARQKGLKNKIKKSGDQVAEEFIAEISEENPELLREITSSIETTGWRLDLQDETVGSDFLLALNDVVTKNADKIASQQLTIGNLCTKVMDVCVGQDSVYPRSFHLHRQALRAQENGTRIQTV